MLNAGYKIAGDVAGLADSLRRLTVEVRTAGRGGGSGILWRDDGLVITNAHVAAHGRLWVRTWDGRDAEATLVARSARNDLAILRVPWRIPGAPFAESSRLRPGDLVFALGAPLGVPQALAMGIVHRAPPSGHGLIEADLRLAPGNSGGPLADATGAVIGINTAIVNGLGVAVPVERAARMVRWLDQRRRAA